MVEVDVPLEAVVTAHYTQCNALIFVSSRTVGRNTIEMMDVCTIPIMCPPYFIEGGTPKVTLYKIELLDTSVPMADKGVVYEFIQQLGHCACVWHRAKSEQK